MLPRNHPDRIQIAFDDPRLVANAGLLLHLPKSYTDIALVFPTMEPYFEKSYMTLGLLLGEMMSR